MHIAVKNLYQMNFVFHLQKKQIMLKEEQKCQHDRMSTHWNYSIPSGQCDAVAHAQDMCTDQNMCQPRCQFPAFH